MTVICEVVFSRNFLDNICAVSSMRKIFIVLAVVSYASSSGSFYEKPQGIDDLKTIEVKTDITPTDVSPPPVIYRDGILERVPPSRPAPQWDKPKLKPFFYNITRTKVISAHGQTAYLHCRIKHLGDSVVTWIRKKDVHVLTVGLFTYTTDGRFTALHSERSDDWTLRIASAQVADSGTYECQVSTEPKISKAFTLHVVEAEARIEGPSEIHMVSGSSINLTCFVTGSPEPPQHMYWYRGKTLINYSDRGGISVVTDKHARTSRLVVSRATLADSGNYTCAPANAQPGSVSVYILNGEHPAAMQGGDCAALHSSRLQLIAFIILLQLQKCLMVCER